METSLHRQLKDFYATDESQIEVTLGDYRIDVLQPEELIEIQCASLSAIRRKTIDLLTRHSVRIVKPIIHRTRIRRRDRKNGKIVSQRFSPKRGSKTDVFEELIYLRGVFPHPRLTLDFPIVDVEETRCKRTRGSGRAKWRNDPGYRVEDVALLNVIGITHVTQPRDMWSLLTGNDMIQAIVQGREFGTACLSESLGCQRYVAQRIAYVLKHAGVIKPIYRDRTGWRYQAVVVETIPRDLNGFHPDHRRTKSDSNLKAA